jgi:hypothetical protein
MTLALLKRHFSSKSSLGIKQITGIFFRNNIWGCLKQMCLLGTLFRSQSSNRILQVTSQKSHRYVQSLSCRATNWKVTYLTTLHQLLRLTWKENRGRLYAITAEEWERKYRDVRVLPGFCLGKNKTSGTFCYCKKLPIYYSKRTTPEYNLRAYITGWAEIRHIYSNTISGRRKSERKYKVTRVKLTTEVNVLNVAAGAYGRTLVSSRSII